MTSLIGQMVSHYRILEHLGGGGMGVVYRAEDTKLMRAVALKFLPPELTRDPEAKARFRHEAQAASALQHQNICVVYDIDETEDGQIFICMEFLQGESLKKKTQRGPLPEDQALNIAVQVAEGLSCAHEAGIVHRDIKPANIMITDRGEVKIVDFGLAKLTGRTSLTRSGIAVGTTAYMSPEQARGEGVDARTDIWSLGVVLYEMLTGRRPFESEYGEAIVYAIMHVEPKGVRALKKSLPREIEQIVSRMLRKDPAERHASAEEVLADLLPLQGTGSRPSASRAMRTLMSRRLAGKRLLMLSVAFALVLAAGVAVTLLLIRGRATNPTNPNYTTRVLASLQFRTNAFFGPAPSYCVPGISSDGNWVAYGTPNDSGRWDINFTHISWARPRKIAEIDDLSYGSVNISPAGDKIAVQAGVAPPRLMLLSTVGGEVRLREPDAIEDSIVTFGGWSPDGTRISYVRRPSPHRFEIWSASNEGADKRIEFVDTVAENIYAVCWSPDGKSMAWSREMEGGVELFARQLAAGEERQLTFDGKFADEPVWLSNGLILFSSNRSGKQSPWLISERGGEPQGVGALGSEIMYLRASLDGTRVITSEFGGLTEIEVTDLAGSRARTVQLGRFVNARWISFSGDFSRIAYFAGEEPGGMVLYVADGSGGNTRRLASVPGGIFFPARGAFLRTWRTAWSPDNRWIAYVEIATNSNDYGGRDLCVIEADHPNDLRRICRSPARWAWIDSTDLVIQTMDMRIGEYSVHAQAPVRQPRDSVYGKPILGGRYFVHDGESRLGTNYRARWVMTTLGGGGGPSGMHRNILPGEPDVEPSPDGSVWLFVPGGQRWTTVGKPEPCGLWKITLPGLRTERVQRAYSKPLMFTMMSDSAKMIANLTHETTMKLTLIENLFR